MAIKRHLWQGTYFGHRLPEFPCPKCTTGKLKFQNDTFASFEPAYSKAMKSAQQIDPFGEEWRFSCQMVCSNKPCGEIVMVIGEIVLDESIDEEYQMNWSPVLLPKAMYPAPPIIVWPKKTPETVSSQIRRSFDLFWSDLGACANRLRISVERLLDEFKIPGGPLFDRIEAFKKVDEEHATTFDALRLVGNVGSHQGVVRRETIIDAFEIYEDALMQLFGGQKARIAALKKKIVDAKGK